jgi:hypothetical protein
MGATAGIVALQLRRQLCADSGRWDGRELSGQIDLQRSLVAGDSDGG